MPEHRLLAWRVESVRKREDVDGFPELPAQRVPRGGSLLDCFGFGTRSEVAVMEAMGADFESAPDRRTDRCRVHQRATNDSVRLVPLVVSTDLAGYQEHRGGHP